MGVIKTIITEPNSLAMKLPNTLLTITSKYIDSIEASPTNGIKENSNTIRIDLTLNNKDNRYFVHSSIRLFLSDKDSGDIERIGNFIVYLDTKLNTLYGAIFVSLDDQRSNLLIKFKFPDIYLDDYNNYSDVDMIMMLCGHISDEDKSVTKDWEYFTKSDTYLDFMNDLEQQSNLTPFMTDMLLKRLLDDDSIPNTPNKLGRKPIDRTKYNLAIYEIHPHGYSICLENRNQNEDNYNRPTDYDVYVKYTYLNYNNELSLTISFDAVKDDETLYIETISNMFKYYFLYSENKFKIFDYPTLFYLLKLLSKEDNSVKKNEELFNIVFDKLLELPLSTECLHISKKNLSSHYLPYVDKDNNKVRVYISPAPNYIDIENLENNSADITYAIYVESEEKLYYNKAKSKYIEENNSDILKFLKENLYRLYYQYLDILLENNKKLFSFAIGKETPIDYINRIDNNYLDNGAIELHIERV